MTRTSTLKQPRSRALLFLMVCLAGSMIARVGDVGLALAQGAVPHEPTVLRPDAPEPSKKGGLAEQAAVCDAKPGPLLLAIRERADALDAREAHLAEREKLVEVAEATARAEITKLEDAEARLSKTLSLADGASERDVAHLVSVYEAMKPKDAAAIFEAMDPKFGAGFLARMRTDAAAGILAAMNQERAYAVTAIMAGRHAGANGAVVQ